MTYGLTQLDPSQRFEIARVLSRMSGVIGRNALVFVGLALALAGLPSLALAIFERGALWPFGIDTAGPVGLGWLLNLLIGALLQAALIHV